MVTLSFMFIYKRVCVSYRLIEEPKKGNKKTTKI